MFVDNIAAASHRLGLTVLAAGLLLAGAEPEELLTGVLAALGGHGGLAAGDAIGANVTMLTAVLGLAALVRPVPIAAKVRSYAVLSAVAGGLALLAVADQRVGRLEGGLLLGAYAGLIAVVWRREQEPPSIGEVAELAEAARPADASEAGRSARWSLLLAAGGLLVMTAGGAVAVEGAARLVAALHQSDSAVGLTVLALATTAELFALVFAAVRHDVGEVAVAAVVGSAAYNATVTLGGAALAAPLRTGNVTGPALAATVLPLVVVALARGGRLSRPAGAALLAVYAVFVFVVLR